MTCGNGEDLSKKKHTKGTDFRRPAWSSTPVHSVIAAAAETTTTTKNSNIRAMKQFGSRTMALLLLAGILLGANLAQLMFRQRFYQGEEKNGGGVKGGGEWQDQDDQWDIWSKEVPSLPTGLMSEALLRPPSWSKKSSCYQLPKPNAVEVANDRWQLLRNYRGGGNSWGGTGGYQVYLHSAHFDSRSGGAVRLITMIDREDPDTSSLRCLFWYSEEKPLGGSNDALAWAVSPVADHQRMGGAPSRTPGRGANLAGGVIPAPFLLSCPVPSGGGGGGGMEPVPPVAVSLLAEQQEEEEVDKECPQVMPNNCLKVERGEEQAPLPTEGGANGGHHRLGRLAICTKAVFFPDDPGAVFRLVEWIELQRILGVDRVFLTYSHVHQTALKALRHYQHEGFVELQEYVWAGQYSRNAYFHTGYREGDPSRMTRQDSVSYNHCYYTASEKNFEYIAILDPDEVPELPLGMLILQAAASLFNRSCQVILPRLHDNLKDMMVEELEEELTSPVYSFHAAYFMDSMADKADPSFYKDTPVHLHMLRNLVRSQKLGEGGEFRQSRMMEKSILRGAKVSQIKTVMAHHPSSCLNGMGSSCRRQQWVSPRVAILAHYREGCQATVSNVPGLCETFMNETVEDHIILKFKDDLIRRTQKVMLSLSLLDQGLTCASSQLL